MNIVIAGGTGFIGEPLTSRLLSAGHDVAILTRDPGRVEAGRGVPWDGRTLGAWSDEAARADVTINLAGENIGAGRWTGARKKRLVESRLEATRALVDAMRRQPSRSRTFISASAVGYYGDRGDDELDETASRGDGFLAGLVDRWESEARQAEAFARVVILRFGVVIGPGGGALGKMLLPFRLGVGGPIGSGNQWMSWVDRDDLLRAVEWVMTNDHARGVYNITAPAPVRNREFARTLGRVLHRPALLPAPGFALRLVLGDMADEALLAGQRVLPRRVLREGFTFEKPEIEKSLADAVTQA